VGSNPTSPIEEVPGSKARNARPPDYCITPVMCCSMNLQQRHLSMEISTGVVTQVQVPVEFYSCGYARDLH
jgi:hypothetical protein